MAACFILAANGAGLVAGFALGVALVLATGLATLGAGAGFVFAAGAGFVFGVEDATFGVAGFFTSDFLAGAGFEAAGFFSLEAAVVVFALGGLAAFIFSFFLLAALGCFTFLVLVAILTNP